MKGLFHRMFGFKFPFRIVSIGTYETMRADGYYLKLFRDRYSKAQKTRTKRMRR